MRYLRAYRFALEGPKWHTNVLAGVVCQMVPVLGQIVFTGYTFELLDTFREEKDHLASFDLDRVPVYLSRGLWPYLVQLVAVLPLLLLIALVGFLLTALASSGHTGSGLSRASLYILGPAGFLALVALSTVLAPVTLHVGFRKEITGDLVPFVQDFFKRVGREALLAQLFVATTGLALVSPSAVAFCLPAYAALALAHFAQYHLLAQLYELYRQRGGAPVSATAPPQPTSV